mmetsp:Transcript_18663/g.26581  ORF Transcript_18663/g.26581 Transcript_18663/m.26581 type:complete len:325 (-) Transcript_18663:153-1127(-)
MRTYQSELILMNMCSITTLSLKGFPGSTSKEMSGSTTHMVCPVGLSLCIVAIRRTICTRLAIRTRLANMYTQLLWGKKSVMKSVPFFHDTSTRQIIFEVSNRGVWVRTNHNQTDNFTERDLYTGMTRRVRRVGGGPRAGGESGYGRKQQSRLIFESGMVDWTDCRQKCGLCGKTDGPFTVTDCCGTTICDTEDQYQINSYEREGQCYRNHRLQSICGFHNSEGHGGDWKTCKDCEDFFHPYDYAVKATDQAVAGTGRKYNFNDNVRSDVHPADVTFPTCHKCEAFVNTTEESVRTLSMRKSFSGGKAICSGCGGSFGKVVMSGM